MKKSFLFLSAITLSLAACGGANNQETANSTTTETTVNAGETLIGKSDCVGCHAKDSKIVGPSYLEIAAKYPSTDENINLLASKIIKGGSGVWGTVPMTPHTNINNDDAKLMAKYILSLKK